MKNSTLNEQSNSTFQERLKKAMEMRGYNQKKLAQEIKVTPQSISYYCSGTRLPDVNILHDIADVLKVSADYLLCLTPVPQSNIDDQTINRELGLSPNAIANLRYEVKCVCGMGDSDDPYIAYKNLLKTSNNSADLPMYLTVSALIEDTPIDDSWGSLLEVIGDILQFETETGKNTKYGLLKLLGFDKKTDEDIFEIVPRAKYTLEYNDILDLLYVKLQGAFNRYRKEHTKDGEQ